jgi:hypothetical protein
MNNDKLAQQPHYPTFPVQDNLGRTIFSMGSSTIVNGAFIIAAGLAHHADSLDPETIADMAIEIAQQIIDKTTEQQQPQTTSSIIK